MLAVIFLAAAATARPFRLGGLTLDLQEVTTNVDVYFTSMRFNRAANEWDVNVAVSNKVSQPLPGPVVLLVDSFTGTTGPLRADGVSSNQFFFDLSGELPQGELAAGQDSTTRTIALGFVPGAAPSVVTRVFAAPGLTNLQALGFTRSLNAVGQPLPGVTISETGPDGNTTNATDSTFGVVTLGKSAGAYVWQFSLNGYLPVWRQAQLQAHSGVVMIPYPRLTVRDTNIFSLSPLTGGAVSNQTVALQFGGGSFSQTTAAQLTLLDGQTLPAFLPSGWSPLQAFWIELGNEPTQPAAGTLVPWGNVASSENAAWVKFNTATLTWQVLQFVPGNGTNALNVALPGSGAYALVVPDAPPIAPPAAALGNSLQPSGVPAPNPANLVASGTVNPGTSPASTVPELVTAAAYVGVTNLAGVLASGTLLRGEVSENYLLQNGTSRMPPGFDDFMVAYQRPGGAGPAMLQAQFPLRPVLLLGPDLLNQGTVDVDLFAPGAFSGGILDTNGGLIASDPVRLLVGPGVFQRQEAIQLRSVNPTNFTSLVGTNFTVAAAFEAAISGVVSGQQVSFQVSGLGTNMTFVLGRVIDQQGLYGVEPRERLHTDVNGNLINDEPASGGLPGLTGSGQYVLLAVAPQQGVVEGVAQNSSGQPAGGLPVSIAGQPWLTFSAQDGSFKLLAPAGAGALSVSDLATGDTGTQAITMPTNLPPLNTSVAAQLNGLQVASITPADNATNVPQVTAIVINFNRAINPATLVSSNAVQLLESNQPVAATFSLNLANTSVTLLPGSSLDAAAQFQVVLSTNIADGIGRPLTGQSVFTFATIALSARDPAAQLIIYEPGATNLATNVVANLPGYVPGTNANDIVVHGTPGCADPGVPVIVVNEGSGATTTVISKSDGSFTTFVSGQEQDFISATFISLNGARLYVPVSRQLFDDGSVGLYPQGGVLQASGDGGAVQLTVPPNAIQTRAKFNLNSINVPELQAQLGGVMPTNATVAGGALNLRIEGSLPTLPLQVSFPVDLATLGYPTNEAPTNAAAELVVVQTNQDVTAFQVMDQLLFTPQSATSQTVRSKLPKGGRPGPQPRGGIDGQITAGFLDTGVGFLAALPGGMVAQNVFYQVIVPILLGPRPVVVKGKVSSIPLEIAIGLQGAGDLAAAVNLQTGQESVDMPFQLFQMMNLKGTLGTLTKAAGAIQLVGQPVAIAVKALQLWVQNNATPLSGAFITLQLVGGPLNIEPGRLNPGMVYCTSGADGSFLTVAPAVGAQYLITATHPLFTDVQQQPVNPLSLNPLSPQGDLSLAGAVFKNFMFTTPLVSQTPPNVSISFDPLQPAPGQPCVVEVDAVQPLLPPEIHIGLVSVGTKNLQTGALVTNAVGTLTNTAVINPTANSVRWTGILTVNQAVQAQLKIFVKGANPDADFGPEYVPIDFNGPTPRSPSPIPAPDTNDIHGPVVMEVEPPDNGFIGANSQMVISFNKPIDAYVTNNLNGIVLSAEGGSAPLSISPIVSLSQDQTTLFLTFPGLLPSTTYRLTLSGPTIRDLATKPLDQRPSTPAADSFTTTFRTPAQASAALPQPLGGGRGAVISGTQLYLLDQSSKGNFLDAYDISTPLKPKLESQLHLFGAPRDLVVIPQFGYKLNFQAPVQSNDLVIVVGGDLNSLINDPTGGAQGTTVSVPGQYLWVVNMGNPKSPEVLASPIVSYRVGSAVTKVRWAPPYVVYEEFGADIQLLGLVNLQEMIIGFNSSQIQAQAFTNSPYGRAGVDLNHNGSYVDPGDSLPLPSAKPPEFYGKHQNYVIQGSTQKILDFSVTPGANIVGVTLGLGVGFDSKGNPTGPSLPFSYRTLGFNGLPLNSSNPTDALFPFGTGSYPRWVSVFDALPIIESNNVPTVISVALVSLEPGTNGLQDLAVLDISLPEQPRLLNLISFPTALLGETLNPSRWHRGGCLIWLASRICWFWIRVISPFQLRPASYLQRLLMSFPMPVPPRVVWGPPILAYMPWRTARTERWWKRRRKWNLSISRAAPDWWILRPSRTRRAILRFSRR